MKWNDTPRLTFEEFSALFPRLPIYALRVLHWLEKSTPPIEFERILWCLSSDGTEERVLCTIDMARVWTGEKFD